MAESDAQTLARLLYANGRPQIFELIEVGEGSNPMPATMRAYNAFGAGAGPDPWPQPLIITAVAEHSGQMFGTQMQYLGETSGTN